jgi:GMP synthase-like glutamine amidotransferase
VLPATAVKLASTPLCTQAFRVGPQAWGIQFHAEVSRTDLVGWIDGFETDPDAVRIGIDPEALRAESAPLIDGWNELGRGICRRFLDVAATRV